MTARRTRLMVTLTVVALLGTLAWQVWPLFLGRGPAGGPLDRQSRRLAEPAALRFVDVTDAAGVDFVHHSGATGKKLNPETFGPGAGWIDYDVDGWPDLLLVDGNTLSTPLDTNVTCRLYRNRSDGTFEDQTEAAGLGLSFYGMGFCSADIDGDGDPDIFLYGLRRCFLLINEEGRFRDATRSSGLGDLTGWIGTASFLDYDLDQRLDLFLGGYVDWSPEQDESLDCRFGTLSRHYCSVASFEATPPRLFRGAGDGSFTETTAAAGIATLRGKALGIVVEDCDRDGDPDVFVANDSVPNFLLENLGDGRFEDRGIESGFATDGDGAALAGMGIDSAWTDSGALLVATGNFSGEPTTVHIEDGGFFAERSLSMDVGKKSLDRLTFGLLLEDLDLDGRVDLVQVNGHVFDLQARTQVPYRQHAQVFLGRKGDTFESAEPAPRGELFSRAILGRAIAAADYDRDGDLDVVVTENQGRARLHRNDTRTSARALRIDLQGTSSHRDAIGAEIEALVEEGGQVRRLRRTRKASSSYLSQSERTITLGVTPRQKLRTIEVRWTNGRRESFPVAPDARHITFVEGSGHALEDARRVVPLAPSSSSGNSSAVTLRRRAARHLEDGRFAAALADLDSVLDSEPADFVAWRLHAMTLYRLRRAEDLESTVQSIRERFPSANLIVSHFALVLQKEGYLELAARFFGEAARLDPRRYDVWTSIGNIHFDRGRYEAALESFDRALSLAPEDLEALTNSAKVATIRKDYDRAGRFVQRALAASPSHAPALASAGALQIARDDFTAAESLLRRALDEARSDAVRSEAWANLGVLYHRTDNRERAIGCFEKALQLDPGDPKARAALERLR